MFYSRRIIAPVIIPGFLSFFMPMAVYLWLPDGVPVWLAIANVLCGLAALLVTVGLEIPRHFRMDRVGKDDRLIGELILYNWPRTMAISGSAILTVMMVLRAFGADHH